jgi:hypothetical protein
MQEKNVKDSIDVAKSKSGLFSKKDFSRKDFGKKTSSLTDSSNKYSNIVFNAASSMSKEELDKKGIKKSINSKGDTTYRYNSNGSSFEKVISPSENAMKAIALKNKKK